MFRCSMLLGMIMLGLALLVGTSDSQEKKEKFKGQLPPGFKALDLTPAQTAKVYEINAEFKSKIDDLNKKITELKGQQKKAQVAVLTDEQKLKYTEYITGEESKAKKKDEKKPGDK